jgi:glycosyltransferase involved in cell wall biosynthesis
MKVSVLVITYNHFKYIGKCLSSILNQKTSFDFEVIIGEDCSSDPTRVICEEFARKDDRIQLLSSNENLGPVKNFLRTYQASKGEYVAFCEGDDFWTDDNKLQIQVQFLDDNIEFAGSFHDAFVVDENNKMIKEDYFKTDKTKFDFEDILLRYQAKEATCSIMYRAKVLHELPNWFLVNACDFYVDLMITQYGYYGRVPKRMSAYRIHSGGVWQGAMSEKRSLEFINRFSLLLDDESISRRYRKQIRALVANEYESLAEHSRSLIESIKIAISYFRWINIFNLKKIGVLVWKILILPNVRRGMH